MGVFLSFCWASEEKNLLNIPADKSPETIWTEVHNKEFQGDFSVDPQGGASGGPCLKINALPADAGEAHPYGEWRFKQQPALEEGVEYAFRAWVKGKVDAPAGAGAYVNIYGFGAQGTPKSLFIRQLTLSETDWTEFEGRFRVPQGIQRARIGVGISQGVGWVSFDRLWLAPSTVTPAN